MLEENIDEQEEEVSSEENLEELPVEELEVLDLPVEEKKKEFIPSYWNKRYTFEELNAMDSFELSDLLEDKTTAVNTKALIIQVLASRGVYID